MGVAPGLSGVVVIERLPALQRPSLEGTTLGCTSGRLRDGGLGLTPGDAARAGLGGESGREVM